MATIRDINDYKLGKIGQAGISSKEQGYIMEIGNASDALASIFTSPTGWTDLINVLDILDDQIDVNSIISERQKNIAEKINSAKNYKKEVIDKLHIIRTEIEKSGDKLLIPAKNAILQEIAEEVNLVQKTITANNIGREAVDGRNTTLFDLKKSYIEQVKKTFGNKSETASRLTNAIKGYKANDSDITDVGIPEINKMIYSELGLSGKGKDYKTQGALQRFKSIDAEKTAKRLVDEALSVYAPHIKGDDGYRRQGAVEAFYQSVNSKMQQILNGSYIKERARKTFGENNKKIDKMVKPLASGQLSLKTKLEQLSQILEKEQYEMYIAASGNDSKIRIGAYKSKDSGKIFNRDNNHKIKSVNWDKMANFELGLDLDGLIDFQGMTKVNQWNMGIDDLNEGYLETLQEKALDNILQAFNPKFNGQESWAMKALKTGDLSSLQRIFRSRLNSTMSGSQGVGSFKRGRNNQDVLNALSGSGSQAQLAIKKDIIGVEDAINKIIYNNKINNLYPQKSANSSAESKLNSLKTDLYQLALAYSLGGQEGFDNLILQNKDFDYLTKSSNFSRVLDGIKEIASLPINMSSIKEGAASSFLFGTSGQEVFMPFGELARGSDRSYSQTQSILKKMTKPKKNILKENMLASSSGLRKGITFTENEDLLYDIGFITEKQISDAYKEFKKQKMSEGMSETKFNKKYGSIAPSVTNDSGIYKKNIEKTFDSYRFTTKRLGKDEYDALFDEIDKENEKKGIFSLSPEDIQTEIAKRLFGFDEKGGDKFRRILFDNNSNEMIFGFDKAVKMKSGTKLLNKAMGTRYTGQGVNSDFFEFLKKKSGYENFNIDEFLSADKFKLKNIPGLLSGRLNYFLSEAKKNGISSEIIDKKLSEQKTLLSDYLKLDNGKFVNQFNIEEKLRELSKDENSNISESKYANNLRNLFTSIEDLGVSLGLQDNNSRGLIFDENGNMLFGKGFTISSGINQADIYHYDESVGDLSDDELYKSRHTFSEKERDSIKRQIGIAKAKNGKDYSDLNHYLENLTAINDKDLKEYKYEIEQNKRAIKETSYSGTNKEAQGVGIGYGEQYDINLEKELNRMGYTEGGIAEGDFVNSIYHKIAEKQELYRKTNGLMDGDYVPTYLDLGTTFGTSTKFGDTEYIFGGNRVYIPTNKIKSRKVGNEIIYDLPSTNNSLNSLLNAVVDYGSSGFTDTTKEKRVQEKSLGYMQAVHNDAFNKEGNIWELGNKTKLKNAGVATVNSVNSYDVLNENDDLKRKILTSSLQMSLEDVKEMISGDLNDLDYNKTLKLNYEDLFGKEFKDILDNNGNVDIKETSKAIQEKILKGLTIGTKEFEDRIKSGRSNGLRAMFHRYPSTSGLDERFTDLFINSGLSQGTIKAGLGILRAANGDSDGDHVYAALTTFGKGITKSIFKDLDDLQSAQTRISEAVASVEAKDIVGYENNIGGIAVPTEAFQNASNKEADVSSSILAKMNKSKVGVLSNLSTAARTILKDMGLDEISAGSDYDSQKNAAWSMITRGIFESMEQEAISSKKVEDRILANAKKDSKNVNKSDEDILSGVLTEVDNLVSNFYNQDLTKRTEFVPELLHNLQRMGILGSDDDIFTGRKGAEIMAGIQQFSYGNDILAEIFGTDLTDKGLQERLFKWDKNGKVIGGNGRFTLEAVQNALKSSNMRVAQNGSGKLLMEQLTYNKNVNGKINAENNPAYTLSKVEGVNQDYSKALDVVAAAHDNATDSIEKHSQALEKEIGLEKEKIKVANGEAVAVGKTADSHIKNATAIENEAEAYIANGKAGIGHSWQDDHISKKPRMSISDYIRKILPNEYDNAIDYNSFNKAINTMDDEIYEKLKNTNVSDLERMKELGISDPNIFNIGRSRYRKTQLGTLSHLASETIANIQKITGEQNWNGSIFEIEEWLKNNAENEHYSKIRDYIQKYKEGENALVRGMQLLGYSQESIDFSKYDAAFRGSENVRAIKKMTEGSTILNPEFKAHMDNYGLELNGIIDAMSYDKNSGMLNIFDYKNTGKVDSNYSLQLLLYEEMIKKLQYSFREKAKKGYKKGEQYNSIDIKNLAQYSSDELKSVFGDIDFDTLDAILNFKNISTRLIQSDNEGNTRIWRGVNRKNVSNDILRKIESGELLTEDEKKQLSLSEEIVGSNKNTDSEYAHLKEKDIALDHQKEYRNDLEKRLSLEKEILEIEAKITAQNNISTEKEIKNSIARIEQIQEEIEILDKKYSEGGERAEWGDQYSAYLGYHKPNTEEIVNKAKKENDEELEKSIKTESSEYLTKLKQTNKIEEQIKSTELAISETPQNDPKLATLRESLALLKQQLAHYDSIKVKLDEQNSALIVGEGENQRILKLNQEQLSNLQRQKAIIDSQHISNLANITAPKQKTGFIEEMFGNFKRQIKYMTTQSVVYKVIGGVQQTLATLINTIKELDKAMVNLQIASGYTREEMKSALTDYNSIAIEMGRSTQEVLSAANDWLRAGYDIKTANVLIKDSMKLSTLGMIDSAKATEYLISTMKGWKLQAEEVSGVVDDLTALDMAFATSAGDIAQAMAKANVSASLAGVDRKTYESMLTAVMDVGQQGADVVGTA